MGLLFFHSWAQEGLITGRVYDEINNEPLPFANVVIEELKKGGTTDENGEYRIEVPPGIYNVTASFIGYRQRTEYEVQVSRAKPRQLDFGLRESNQTLQEVKVSAQDKFERKEQSPVSVSSLGINEIQRNPGGNQDISLVIQSLPGVASTPNFRNDIIIRGGAPNENSFFLDGIEIPNINHFATQGSSGGPVGLINVNFIREVDLYTSSFPVQQANALSSVLDIKLKEGRNDKLGGTFQVGATDVGLTLEGPIGEKTTFLASARRSYLQFLFSVLELPFLPIYNDFQFKVKHKFSNKDQLIVLGLGAIDNFALNTEANETEAQRFQLAFLPVNEQWNYSIGAKYTHFGEKSYTNYIISRSMLNNTAFKFEGNDEQNRQLLDYESFEVENKLRVENIWQAEDWRLTNGFGLEEAKFQIDELDLRVPPGADIRDYQSDLRLFEYYLFSSANRSFLEERLSLTLGLRLTGNSFNADMANPLNQFSPKVALRYNLNENFSLNMNYSRYFQKPPYTALGYRDSANQLVNNDLRFISTDHYVLGAAYYLPFNAKVSVEGFYKRYANYPFLTDLGVSLANLGSDFGVIGNAPAVSSSEGVAYGMEVLYQQKLYKGWFGTMAYTLVKSEFTDGSGVLVPSAWDNQHIVTLTGGKKFGKNWEAGIQYQFLGGAPYTPTDVYRSSLVSVYEVNQRGLPDYDRLNSERFDNFNRLNVRIDKKWFFEKWSLNLYFDVQNALAQSIEGAPILALQRDAQGNPITFTDPQTNEQRYRTKRLTNETGTVIPSLGIIVRF